MIEHLAERGAVVDLGLFEMVRSRLEGSESLRLLKAIVACIHPNDFKQIMVWNYCSLPDWVRRYLQQEYNKHLQRLSTIRKLQGRHMPDLVCRNILDFLGCTDILPHELDC